MEHLKSISTDLCDFNYLRFRCNINQPFVFAGLVSSEDCYKIMNWRKEDYVDAKELVLRFDKIIKVDEYQNVHSVARGGEEDCELHDACSYGVLSVNVSVVVVDYCEFEIKSCKGRFTVMCEDSSWDIDDKAIRRLTFEKARELASKVNKNRETAANKVFRRFNDDNGFEDRIDDRHFFKSLIYDVSHELKDIFNSLDNDEIKVRYHRHDANKSEINNDCYATYEYDSKEMFGKGRDFMNSLLGEYLEFIDTHDTGNGLSLWSSPFEFGLVWDVKDISYYFVSDCDISINSESQGSEQKG